MGGGGGGGGRDDETIATDNVGQGFYNLVSPGSLHI